MKSKQRTGLCAIIGLAVAGYASPALAAPLEYVTVILDQTGSMLDETNKVTRWVDAIKAARGVVNGYSASTTTAYGIWTFKQQAGVQDGAQQIWPLSAADCPGGSSFETINSPEQGASFYCQPSDTADHTDVLKVFDDLAKNTTQVPQPDWLTPLADTLCQLMERVGTSSVDVTKTFLFESDAGENVSHLACSSSISNELPPGPWTYTTTATSEWGMTPNSWQARVVRKLDKFTTKLADAVTNPLPTTTEAVFKTRLTNLFKVNWNVAAHYKLYPESANTLMAMSATPSGSMQLFLPTEITDTSVNQMLQAAPARVTVTTKASKATALTSALAASSTRYVSSMSAADLAFLKALGTSSAKSKFREIATIDGTVFGTNHRLPGDVDDSGCTDQADLNIIKQRDVWLQRAVLPLQIAIRADVSRDGWVDKDDVNVVVAHWAQGCINPVRPPKL